MQRGKTLSGHYCNFLHLDRLVEAKETRICTSASLSFRHEFSSTIQRRLPPTCGMFSYETTGVRLPIVLEQEEAIL